MLLSDTLFGLASMTAGFAAHAKALLRVRGLALCAGLKSSNPCMFKKGAFQEYYRKHMCTTDNDFPVIMGDITEGDDSDGNG